MGQEGFKVWSEPGSESRFWYSLFEFESQTKRQIREDERPPHHQKCNKEFSHQAHRKLFLGLECRTLLPSSKWIELEQNWSGEITPKCIKNMVKSYPKCIRSILKMYQKYIQIIKNVLTENVSKIHYIQIRPK